MRLPFNHFDLLARKYDRLLSRPADDPLPGLVATQPGACMVDVGGGTGRNAETFRAAGCWVVVCDASREMLRRALARNLPVVCADVTRLPFASGVFDRALVVDAFHHFVEPSPAVAQQQAIVQILRILKRKGRLILEEPNPLRWQGRVIAAVERTLLMGSRFVTPEFLVELVAREGWQCIRREDRGFSVGLVFERTITEDEWERV